MPQIDEEHFRKLERMYNTAPINDFFRPDIKVSQGRAEVRVQVRRDFFHAAGAAHGAVYFKMLDDAAWFAVNSLVTDAFVLTVDFTVNLTRPFNRGLITSIGEVPHHGGGTFVGQSKLLDEKGRVLGMGRGVFIKGKKPLTPEIGYS